MMEAVLVRVGGEFSVVILGQPLLVLLLPNVAQPLEEQQPKDVVLVVGAVDLAPQNVGGSPEVAFKLGEGELLG